MHPLLLLLILLIFSNSGNDKYIKKGPSISKAQKSLPALPPLKKLTYFDTFKMELLLDHLHATAEALEKINYLNQLRQVPLTKKNSVSRIQESVDAAKTFVKEDKKNQQLDMISNTLSGVQKIGSLENIMSAMGPIMAMLSGGNDDDQNDDDNFSSFLD